MKKSFFLKFHYCVTLGQLKIGIVQWIIHFQSLKADKCLFNNCIIWKVKSSRKHKKNTFFYRFPKFCVTPGQLKMRPSQKIFHFGLFEPTNTFLINETTLAVNLRNKNYVKTSFKHISFFLRYPGTVKNRNFPVNLHLYIKSLIKACRNF